jgi:hypothetical protein
MYLGAIKLGANLTFYANTHTPSTGAAVDADAVPGYRVYEDEVATPLLTGSMALFDDANTVGFYSEQIAVTAGNGFESGKSYGIRVTGVVGGVTGVELHQFDVRTRLDDDLAYPAVSGRSLDVDGSGVVKANLAQILGTALTETVAGYLSAAFKKFFDKATPTGTINSLPDAVPAASGGLPTTNGTKLNQTVDLTAGQQIDLVNAPNATAIAAIQSGLATSSALSTLAAVFSGITSLANWLRGLARKDTMNAIAKSELNSGGGTYDETTKSLQALGDTTGAIVLLSPIISGGDAKIKRGDDYHADDSRQLDWSTSDAATWPDLTGATVNFYSNALDHAMTVVTATGANKKIRLQLTAAETLAASANSCPFEIRATLTSGRTITLAQGHITIEDQQT